MLALRKPSEEKIRDFLACQCDRPFSYADVGASQQIPPPGYNVDHHRLQLGKGQATFAAACSALRRWEMFHLGWVQLYWAQTPIKAGEVVAVLGHQLGLWLLNACRIVYVVEEAERFGFAYGTLPEHVESGEERFTVEWHQADDSVWYDLLAFSRPNQWIARLGYAYVRRQQKRFALDSLEAMRQAVTF
jgi:uncharacterized protein (UPF0548 family)